jgi:hypothetical protein
VLKQGLSKYFTTGVKFCTQQTTIPKGKGKKMKKQEEKIVVARYENLDLDSGACK